jgi:hypothetical protein
VLDAEARADAVAGADVCGVLDTDARADVVAGAVVCGVPDAEARADADVAADALPVAGRVVEDRPPPVGDGVRVTDCVSGPDDEVSGVGVKVDGTEEPPAVQAETAIASKTAPAARRPAASHASEVAAGVLSRIFMDPPRTRVRCTR